jgi:two-component system, NarL family, invasion response regulator UvrY
LRSHIVDRDSDVPFINAEFKPAMPLASPTDCMHILLADDHSVVRQGLRQILSRALPCATFEEATNAAQVASLVSNQYWSVVVLDISLPDRNGLEALRDIKQIRPSLPVIMLSIHSEDQYAVPSLKAGAAGYLTKTSATEELVKAIRKVVSGGRYVSAGLAEQLASNLDLDASVPLHRKLSDREYQVMLMIAAGKPLKEIGVQLWVSIKTVSTYRSRILEKMNAKHNADLTRYAVMNNLID